MDKRKAIKTYLAYFSPLNGERRTVYRDGLSPLKRSRSTQRYYFFMKACRKMACTSGEKRTENLGLGERKAFDSNVNIREFQSKKFSFFNGDENNLKLTLKIMITKRQPSDSFCFP